MPGEHCIASINTKGQVLMVNQIHFIKIKQVFPRPVISDPVAKVLCEMEKIRSAAGIGPGRRTAITAGSRGIKNIVPILRAVAEAIRRAGGEPFIVGAMGSHGGGTAAGQREVLQSLGIAEETVGCPVRTSDQVVAIGSTSAGVPVYCDAEAWGADGIVVVNRVKPHTTFHGPVESGLYKMMVVGLGKAQGATAIHRLGPHRMAAALLEMGGLFVRSGKIVAGVAIVENSCEDTAVIETAAADGLEEMERRLLQEAYRLLPRLPAEHLDFLVVQEMGKNISGTGMDTNVIGRARIAGVPEPDSPFIARVVVLDLTGDSHGNATGIGLADFTTRRLADKINWNATYLNCITSGNVQRAMLPITMADDREAVEAALRSLSAGKISLLKGALIKNTLEMTHIWVTESLAGELSVRPGLGLLSEPQPLAFSGGRLVTSFE